MRGIILEESIKGHVVADIHYGVSFSGSFSSTCCLRLDLIQSTLLSCKGDEDYAEASRLTIESDTTRWGDNIMMIIFHNRYKQSSSGLLLKLFYPSSNAVLVSQTR